MTTIIDHGVAPGRATDVLPRQTDELAVPVELNTLQPWHTAHKQFVRQQQWLHYARDLIKRERGRPALRSASGALPEVRYLTLPGIDYLDVRMLAALCRELDCDLTSTGFQMGREMANRYVARAQVREESLKAGGYITDQSYTFISRLEEIAAGQSPAYRFLARRGPFHIVNIDACGSISRPADTGARLIDAIHRIVEYQLQHMTDRWLLFLTTNASYGSISSDTLMSFWRAVADNARENKDFRSRLYDLLGATAGDRQIRDMSEDVFRQRSGEDFLKIFSLSFAKWVIRTVRNEKWKMKTHRAYCYATKRSDMDNASIPTIACLAFEFVPPSRNLLDNYNVVPNRPASARTIEDMSIRSIEKIKDMDNLDTKLRRDNALRSELYQNLKSLLEDAGYEDVALQQLERAESHRS